MNLTINRNPVAIPDFASTFGDVLDWLETDCLQPGQCITRVAIDGSEELNYRSPGFHRLNLDSLSQIEVESGDFDSVLPELLDELTQELKLAREQAMAIVECFDNHRERDAYSSLGQLLESLRFFNAVFSEDLGWQYAAGTNHQEWKDQMAHLLTELVAAQENLRWSAICDVLEWEAIPLLDRWAGIVETTRERLA